MNFSIPVLDARKSAILTVGLVAVGFWLVVLTFPKFYIFNPLETEIAIFRYEQIVSVFGSVLYAFLPLVFAMVPVLNGKSTKALYLFSASLWPVAVFVIQTTIAFQGGGFYSYLIKQPIFALNDLVGPIVLILMSAILFPISTSKARKTTKRR